MSKEKYIDIIDTLIRAGLIQDPLNTLPPVRFDDGGGGGGDGGGGGGGDVAAGMVAVVAALAAGLVAVVAALVVGMALVVAAGMSVEVMPLGDLVPQME